MWLREYHVDGLRVDAVASMLYLDYSRAAGEWEPNPQGGREDLDAIEFLRLLNESVHAAEPGVLSVAEESTAWPGVTRPTSQGGLGFGFKWNMGWMHDTLDYFSHDPVHRRHHHHELTFSMVYAGSENFVLPLSHDEVVHGKRSLLEKMPGDRWQQFANLRALYGHMWAHPGKQLLFMGGEFGQEREWSHERALDWDLLERPEHEGVQRLVRDLNAVYKSEPTLWDADYEPEGFTWLVADDADHNVFAFRALLRDGSRTVVCVGNLSPVPRHAYRLGLPRRGRWREALNTDSRRLRRLRRRQPRRSRGRRRPRPRSTVVDHARAPAAVRRLAGARHVTDSSENDDHRPLLGARGRVTAWSSSECGHRTHTS